MKIKEVSLKTGLTEKAIRLYIENGLIHPHVETGIYRNSYTFSESDVRELNEISVFRKAGFSIFEITLIKEMPEKLPELLNKKMMTLEMEIDEKKSVKEAISRLEVHELGNATQVASSLENVIKKDEEIKENVSKRWLYIVITVLILTIFLLYVYSKGGLFSVKLISGCLFFIIALISGMMSIRYATYIKRANKLSNKSKGTVISVVEEHGFDTSFSVGKGGVGTKEPGIGGIWQIFFMLWNEIRPDCWFPVILYNTDNERKESATVPYGSFKNVWQVGDIIEIAWKDTVPSIVYPLNKKWISKKVSCYVVVSIVAFLAFCIVIASIGGING